MKKTIVLISALLLVLFCGNAWGFSDYAGQYTITDVQDGGDWTSDPPPVIETNQTYGVTMDVSYVAAGSNEDLFLFTQTGRIEIEGITVWEAEGEPYDTTWDWGFPTPYVTEAYWELVGDLLVTGLEYGIHTATISLSDLTGELISFDQDVMITPEPATMLLLGVGLVGLAGIGRKKLFRKA